MSFIKEVMTDYSKGATDCLNGVPHVDGKGEAYDRGYSEQYAVEQQLTHQTEQQMKEANHG
jgi:hypothetical protein